MEDNKDSKEKTDSKYNYFEEPLLFKNFRKNPININGTWNVVYVVNNKVKPDSIWEADYHVSNNFIQQGDNTYLTNEKVNEINAFLDKYFPFVDPVYVQKDAVVFDKILATAHPSESVATNSVDSSQAKATKTKSHQKEFEKLVFPQYMITPKPVDVDLTYTTLVNYPDTIMVEPAIEDFIQVSWKKSSRRDDKLLGDYANYDHADEGMYHYPQILDIAYAKPVVNANSEVNTETFPDVVDVKPSDIIADEFILNMARDIWDSTKIEKNEYPQVLDFSSWKQPQPIPFFNPKDLEINFEVQPQKPALIYPWQMVVDYVVPKEIPVFNPKDLEINFEVTPQKPALIYPWQMVVDYTVPKEIPVTYPSELSVERSDVITDDFIVDLAHDIIESMVEKSEFPQALDLSNLQIAPTPILISEPNDIDIQLNFDEFKKEPIKPSFPTIVRLNRSSEVVDPFILHFAKQFHEAQEAKKPALVYPWQMVVDFKEPAPVKPKALEVNFEVTPPKPALIYPWQMVVDFKEVQPEKPKTLEINFDIEPKKPALVYPWQMEVDYHEPSLANPKDLEINFEVEPAKPTLVYPWQMVVDFKEVQPANPKALEINFDIEPKKPALVYPWQMEVDFEMPEMPKAAPIANPETLEIKFEVPPKKPALVYPSQMEVEFEMPELPQPAPATNPEALEIEFELPQAPTPVAITYPDVMDVTPSEQMVDPFVLSMLKQQKTALVAKAKVIPTYPSQIDLYNAAMTAKAKNDKKQREQTMLCYPDILSLTPNKNVLIDEPLIKTVVVEKEVMVPVEKKVYIPVEINKPYEVVKEVNVPVFVDKPVFIDKPIEIIKDQPVEITKEVVVEKPVEVTKEVVVEKPIEIIKEKPIEITKEVVVEKPVEVTKEVVVEKPIEIIKDQPIEITKEVVVEKPIEVTKEVVVEKPIEIIKDQPVEVTKEVVVEKPVEVPKEVVVEKPIHIVKEIYKEPESKQPTSSTKAPTEPVSNGQEQKSPSVATKTNEITNEGKEPSHDGDASNHQASKVTNEPEAKKHEDKTTENPSPIEVNAKFVYGEPVKDEHFTIPSDENVEPLPIDIDGIANPALKSQEVTQHHTEPINEPITTPSPVSVNIKVESMTTPENISVKPSGPSQPETVEVEPSQPTHPESIEVKPDEKVATQPEPVEVKKETAVTASEPTPVSKPETIEVKPSQPTHPESIEVKPDEKVATQPKPVEVKKETAVTASEPTPVSKPETIEVTPDANKPGSKQVQIPPVQTGGSPINLTINVNYIEPSHQTIQPAPVQQTPTPVQTPNFTIEKTTPGIPQIEGVKPTVQVAKLLESHPEPQPEKKEEEKVELKEPTPVIIPVVQEPIIIDKSKDEVAKEEVEEVEDAFDELDDDSEEAPNQKVYKPYITLYNGNRPMSSDHMLNRYGLDKKQLGKVEQKPKNLKAKQSKAKTPKAPKATATGAKKK